MASSSAIRAGRAFIELLWNTDKLSPETLKATKEWQDAGKQMQKIGLTMGAVGAAITVPMTAATVAFAEVGTTLQHASEVTGIAVPELSKLKYAADQNEVAFDSLQVGLRKFQQSIYEAGQGTKESVEAFKALGLSVDDLKGKSPDVQMQLIADRMRNVTDESTRTGIAMALFGRAGTDLLPMLSKGGAALEQLEDKASSLSDVMSDDAAENARKLSDSFKDAKTATEGLSNAIGNALAPEFTKYNDELSSILPKLTDFINEHQNVTQAVFNSGVTLTGIATTLTTVGFAWSNMKGILQGVGEKLGFVKESAAGTLAVILALTVAAGELLAAWGVGRIEDASAAQKTEDESELKMRALTKYQDAQIRAADAQRELEAKGAAATVQDRMKVADAIKKEAGALEIYNNLAKTRDETGVNKPADPATAAADAAESHAAIEKSDELARKRLEAMTKPVTAARELQEKNDRELFEMRKRRQDELNGIQKRADEAHKELMDKEQHDLAEAQRQVAEEAERRLKELGDRMNSHNAMEATFSGAASLYLRGAGSAGDSVAGNTDRTAKAVEKYLPMIAHGGGML